MYGAEHVHLIDGVRIHGVGGFLGAKVGLVEISFQRGIRLLAFIMGLLESMGQNSYPPQAGTASKHPPVVPKSKK